RQHEADQHAEHQALGAHRSATSASRFAYSSTVAIIHGGITVVASCSSTMAGPVSDMPGASAYRSYTGVSAYPRASGKYARRTPLRLPSPLRAPALATAVRGAAPIAEGFPL